MSVLILLAVFVKAVSSDLLGPEIVIAERGSSVNITCRYDISPVNIHGRKFWCKISGALTGCSTIISSTPYAATAGYKDRTWLVDNPANGTFQLEMVELTQEDGGQYRCGIGQSNDGFFSSVFLAISEGPNMTDYLELVSGDLHGSVSVRCRFPESQNKKTYWCKMRKTGACRILADTEGYVEKRYMGRLLVIPEDTGGVVKILTNQLTPEDAGWYRCGTGTFRSGGRWKDVQVVVTTESTMRLSTAPTDEKRASTSAMDSRGSSQSPPRKFSFTRNSDDPERGVSDVHLIESSNYTNVKEGSLKSKTSLLLVLVPSLLLGFVLIAVGFFVITKARCMKHRVRQPVDENRTQVALEETMCLQKSAGGGSSNLTGEKETDVDHREVFGKMPMY